MKHVVMFSGGVGSWAAAKRVAEAEGTDDLVLLFTDTKMEDQDLYRFLSEAADDVGGWLEEIAEGRDPWQIFFDERFLGNTRADPCSKILKRQLSRSWIENRFEPHEVVVYVGIDWTESHRFERARKAWKPFELRAPLCDPPLVEKSELLLDLRDAGIEPPRLYDLGFPHNNCGGFCIKAGQAHFANLLRHLPDRYAYHERREQELSEHLGRKVTVLRDRRDGSTTPLSLREFRERIEHDVQPDLDWGGCGCFTP